MRSGFITATATTIGYKVFDSKRGALIHFGSAGNSVAPTGAPPDFNGSGNSQLVQSFLVSMRNVAPPWAKTPMPTWWKTFHSMTYEGQVRVNIPGAAAMAYPMRSTLTPVKRGNGWIKLRRTLQPGGVMASGGPTSADDYVGQSDLAPIGIGPAVLARLQPNQVIDQDVALKMQTRLLGRRKTPKGTILVIGRSNGVMTTECGYDMRNGMLVTIRLVDGTSHTDSNLFMTGFN